MVSRRNYLTIAMMFVILLFMFQFTGVMKEQLSEYESNEYAGDTTTSLQRSDAFLAEQSSAGGCEVIYAGEAEGAVESVVKTWCSYRKRTLFCSSSIAQLDSLQDDALQVFVVDGSKVTSEGRGGGSSQTGTSGGDRDFCNPAAELCDKRVP